MKNDFLPPDPTTPRELLIYYLNRIYDGKTYIKDCVPVLKGITNHKTLQLALDEMVEDVHKQLNRMSDIYDLLNEKPAKVIDTPMSKLIKNACELRNTKGTDILNDVDIMIHMQLVEHVNIISYRMMKKLATSLKLPQVEQLLIECFDESKEDDQLFKAITDEYLSEKV
ncbi:DUF892 family protein [Mucilaginibacter sp. RS28]|uniref:DUF892 family protein n=1 Tax=Mucilaginibacter straminoryzae TaxID=2932774 RepID=A0A9X2BCC1_9SPHI|nr:DUF892 family protein [Mucilaginibacter straminoryzae]MCJ8209163.1 DUF892 family protein [Mucilaginibacter straminoryzae]